MNNIILMTDSYKASHYLQYPPGTEYVSSYGESRGSDRGWKKAMMAGLQMLLKGVLSKPITQEDIDEAEAIWTAHGEPFNREGWMHILNEHGGYLPVRIEAVPEGTVVENGNVLFQVVNTDPKVPWLTSYLETVILRAVWFPTTVATQDMHIKRAIIDYLNLTSDNPEGQAEFMLHDFGARGTSSHESAAIGGTAHLFNFMGTDTIEGVVQARRYYGANMPAFSIPAAEHSTITAWGGPEREIEAFKNMIHQFGGDGKLYAVVSDSYDIMAACDKWLKLKNEILEKGGTLVIRPDSGEPTEMVPKVINRLMENFGYVTNSKGYRVLPDYIRVIQGDGINETSIKKILAVMESDGLSADNITFGMGGALLQQLDRDTLKFAMKASAIKIKGMWYDVYKNPVTDTGKRSKRGILALKDGKTYRLEEIDSDDNMLEVVFEDGHIKKTYSLDEIRERAKSYL